MKTLAQTITGNSVLLLILGYLSIAIYYDYFDIRISTYLEVSEILVLSIPPLKVINRTLLISAPILLILASLNRFFKSHQNKPASNISLLDRHMPERRSPFNRTSQRIVILMLATLTISTLLNTITFLRTIMSLAFGTPEFYLHPSSRLWDIIQFTILIMATTCALLLFRIVFSKTATPKPLKVRSLTRYSPAMFLGIAFLVNIFYLYADVCRIFAGAQSKSFIIQTNLRKEPFTSKQFKMIGTTKNYYFLKDTSGITTIKAENILYKVEKNLMNMDTYDSMEFWNISPFSIIPPSLQSKSIFRLIISHPPYSEQ